MVSDTITNAMTVDVEDYFQVAALARAVDRGSWDNIEPRVEQNTDMLLEIFDESSIQATFFILGWIAERHPGLVRRIQAQGHEIACHGYSHELIYKQSQQEFTEETRRAKAVLEEISGEQVRGYRAASYSITSASLWAIETLVNAGFEYDSSIVPVQHDYYGLIGGEVFPHRLSVRDGRSIIEFPPSTVEILGKRIPIGGGGYFRIFPYWFSKWGLDVVNSRFGKPFSFYLHPWEIDPDQPRVRTGLKSRFRHYTNLDKCKDRLIRLQSDFKFSTMQSVIDAVELRNVSVDAIENNSAANARA